MPRTPYRLEMPARVTTPVVVASPHSGRFYPLRFVRRAVIDERALRSSEDAFIDMLVGDAPALGAPLLAAEYPRAYVDLNRACDELDPALIDGTRRIDQNPRISSGLGVIPRVVAGGRAIYRGKLPLAEAQTRLDAIWRPYHAKLDALISAAQARFGEAVLIDFHSMPHEALEAIARPGQARPQVVLGDRFGASARADLVDRLEAAFAEEGFVVTRNAPFAGAYITQAYGRPSRGRHAIQVEIDRALYMDERAIRPLPEFEAVKATLGRILRRFVGPEVGSLAAE